MLLVRYRFLLLLLLCIAPIYAASPPVGYDRWVNQGGVIQASCPAGYTCTESSASDNMLQRILTRNNSGETYIQVIIDDNTPGNGQHRSETFVNASNASNISIPFSAIGEIMPVTPVIGGADQIDVISLTSANSGIATKYTIGQTGFGGGTNSNFDYSVQLSTGWASNPGQAAFTLQQHVTNTTPQGIVFDYTFDYTQNRDATGRITGWDYGLNEFVQNSSVISVNGGTPDNQRFVLRRVSGDFVTAGSATLPPSVGGMGMGMGGVTPNPANGGAAPPLGTVIPNPQATPFPNPPGAPTGNPMGMGGGGVPPGGSVAWNTGNEVQVIWIGQVCPGCMIGMGGMGMMGGAGSFGFQQYENVTTGQSAASRTIQGTAPFVWNNPPFGPQPLL